MSEHDARLSRKAQVLRHVQRGDREGIGGESVVSPIFTMTGIVEGFPAIRQAVWDAGYGDDLEWQEAVTEPTTADEFARAAIFVICNSGMKHTVAQGIFRRVMAALDIGKSAHTAFGHKGKATAIDDIWARRQPLLWQFRAYADKLAFCESLPWIGAITKYHLAKNLGVDVAKPDVHLQRLANANGCTVEGLCRQIAEREGLRVASVDVVLWRACAIGLINTRQALAA